MKKYLIFSILAMVIMTLAACSIEKPMKPDTPEKTAILLKQAISNEEIERLNDLLIEGKKETITLDTLKELKAKMTSGAELKTYEILKFENGEMVLVHLSENQSTGGYEVADFKVVPEDMKGLFE